MSDDQEHRHLWESDVVDHLLNNGGASGRRHNNKGKIKPMSDEWKKFANSTGALQYRYFINGEHKASVWNRGDLIEPDWEGGFTDGLNEAFEGFETLAAAKTHVEETLGFKARQQWGKHA